MDNNDDLSSVCEGISSCAEGNTYAQLNAPAICQASQTKLKSELSNALGACFIDIMSNEQCEKPDVDGCVEDVLLDACADEAAATACEAALAAKGDCGPLDIQSCGSYLSGMLPATRTSVLSCVTEGTGCPVRACALGTL